MSYLHNIVHFCFDNMKRDVLTDRNLDTFLIGAGTNKVSLFSVSKTLRLRMFWFYLSSAFGKTP